MEAILAFRKLLWIRRQKSAKKLFLAPYLLPQIKWSQVLKIQDIGYPLRISKHETRCILHQHFKGMQTYTTEDTLLTEKHYLALKHVIFYSTH